MKIKSERDFWSGMMFVAVGVIFAIGATNYSMGPPCPANDPCAASLWARMSQLSAHPGAGYFPLGLSILLALLGAIVLFKSLTIESEGGDPIEITPPAGGYQLDAVASDGTITLPEGMLDVTTTGSEHRATGPIKGGGPTLTIRSRRGNITVRTR